jgi:hypothetical protein
MPWEYMKATLNAGGSGNGLKVYIEGEGSVDANELGEENWEMVGIIKQNPSDHTTNDVGIFKRFVENDETA